MTVFFQHIPDDHFNIDFDFLVKESKTMNIVIGFFYLVFSLVFAFMYWPGWLLAISAIAIIARGFRNITVMTINKKGFFYYGQLITDWNHFIDVEFIDEVPLPDSYSDGTSDLFYLMIKYEKEGEPGYYGRKIRLTDTQDKSEEEIIAAIKFYYKNSQKIIQ